MPVQKHWHFLFKPYMDIGKCYKIGFILKPHGLKGGVTISIEDDAPNDVSSVKNIFILEDHNLVPYFIQSVSIRGNKAFVKFEDVDSPEAAAKISKHTIYLPKTERPKSGRGEFYDDEITGFAVEDEVLGPLGEIEDVMTAGPNRLLVLSHQGKEVLIPINSPFIVSVNKSRKRILVNLPEGFLDI
jgi:16S rRNA processing protein RimM